MKTRHRLSPDEAFARYVTMGHERGIRPLHQILVDEGADPPSVKTLLNWSARFDWQERVREHDRQVSEEVRERLRNERAVLVTETGVKWLQAMHGLVERVSELAPNAENLREVVDALVELAKQGVELGALPVANGPSDEPANGATSSCSPASPPAAKSSRDIFGELLPNYVNVPTQQSHEKECSHG